MRRAGHRWWLGVALIAMGCVGDGGDEPSGSLLDAGGGQVLPITDAGRDGGQALDAAGAVGARDASAPDASPADAAMSLDANLPARDASAVDATSDTGSAEAGNGEAGAANGESGRLAGITAAHNMVRAMVQTSSALPPMVWSPTIAAYAQQWADTQASTACAAPSHRSGAELNQKGYGENLAVFFGIGGAGAVSTPQQAVAGWAGEVSCWTYGTISGFGIQGTEKCDQACYKAMSSDGCGHYTQIVWRKSVEVGCGVATCNSGRGREDIWICNYSPAGNFAGQAPY